jgi:hypothetical protein
MTTALEDAKQFNWQPQPQSASLVREVIDDFLARCPNAAELARRLKHDTGTRFIDWIDFIQVPRASDLRKRLTDVGFTRKPVPGEPDSFVHDGAMFPTFVIDPSPDTCVGIKVDSIVDFLSAWHITDEHEIDGDPLCAMRKARVWEGDGSRGGAELWVVERHGYRGFAVPRVDPDQAVLVLRHQEAFRRRTRDWDDDDLGFDHLHFLVDAAVKDIGQDYACDIFFAAEREYWQRRNRAAQIQKSRQDKLGLGWANHDHHTYRSSRQCFTRLIALFEKLGFRCRERFYAGAEAGWGAQVIEQPNANITIFADVDLSPEEIMGDFAHEPLPPRKELGTVGLWCGLHGEAILQAGMHHLECQFDFQSLKDQLEAASIRTMDPFTNFPFLTQAFTEGERWPVADKRIQRLVEQGLITPAQAHWFRMQGGAIGSHLENLERNDGYKGFNQHGVSEIIAKTDPRKQGRPESTTTTIPSPIVELIGA